MKRFAICSFLALTVITPSAQAATCGAVMDELATAVAGQLTMSPEKKAAMLRRVTSSYDACMAGDTKGSEGIRDLIMAQIKESLGQK